MSLYRPLQPRDWTVGPTGRSNDSETYKAICRHVESLIRGDAHKLIAGLAGDTAALIVSNLAYVWGMRPTKEVDHEGQGPESPVGHRLGPPAVQDY